MAGTSASVTIALPVLDELATLEGVVRGALAALATVAPNGQSEVLVVDDGSTDGSGALADRLAAAEPRVRVLHHPRNLGYAAVQRACFAGARGDWVLLLPADGQVAPSHLGALLAATRAAGGDAELVVGVPGPGSEPVRPSSRVYHACVRVLFGRRSWLGLGPCLLARRALVLELALRSRTPVLMTELAVRTERAGAVVRAVPVVVARRHAGRSARSTLYARAPRILRELVDLRRAVT